MLDIFDLANDNSNIQIFTDTVSAPLNQGWHTWQKPRGCNFVYMMVFGGGGGGGGGSSGPNTARTGGGGGGSSVGSFGIFPASFLPDTLYVKVGTGGAGGLPQSSGGAGGTSYVSVRPDTTTINVILLCNGGGAGTNTSAAGAGGGGNLAQSILGNLGNTQTPSGFPANQVSGSSGGANTGGNGTLLTVNHIVSGGAGGGGASNTNVNGSGASASLTNTIYQDLVGGIGGGTNPGPHGVDGVLNNLNLSRILFQTTGGAGGGANGTGLGGNGGDGGLASGGGGAGAGLVGGLGGRGGSGFVIIITF